MRATALSPSSSASISNPWSVLNRSHTFKDAVKNGFNGWPITITWRDVIDIVDDIRNEKVLDDFTKQNFEQLRVRYYAEKGK